MYALRLNKSNHSVKVRKLKQSITLKQTRPKINLKHSGLRGPQGIQGETGPQGEQGEQGEVGSDLNFVQNFTITDTVVVNHNLNKYPAVTVIDSAGDEVTGEIYYLNTAQLVVSFTNPFSGKVTCN